jgi:hypothetical protein
VAGSGDRGGGERGPAAHGGGPHLARVCADGYVPASAGAARAGTTPFVTPRNKVAQ